MAICPRCGVRIDGDYVIFSHGSKNTNTRQHLYARVCQYVEKKGLDGCINTQVDRSSIKPHHGYGGVEGLHPEVVDTVNQVWNGITPAL